MSAKATSQLWVSRSLAEVQASKALLEQSRQKSDEGAFTKAPASTRLTAQSAGKDSASEEECMRVDTTGLATIVDGVFRASYPSLTLDFGWYVPGTWHTVNVPCDVSKTDTEITYSIEIPGVKREEIELSVVDRQVTISGQSRRGEIKYKFSLDRSADASTLEAKLEDGVLTIVAKKLPSTVKRIISIK